MSRSTGQVLVYRNGKVYHKAIDSRATPACSPWGAAGQFTTLYLAREDRVACRRCWPRGEGNR